MQNPSILIIAALFCVLSLADASAGSLPRPTVKSVELQQDDIVILGGSARTIQGFAEGINFVTRSSGERTFCASLITQDGVNPTITQNVDTDERIKIYDKLTAILDAPEDSTTIGFSCSVGVDSSWVIGNTLFSDFFRRGYVLRRLDNNGSPDGPLIKIRETGDSLPNNNTATFLEPGLSGLAVHIIRNGESGGLFEINVSTNDILLELVGDSSTFYLEGPDTISGFGSFSITATDTIGFGAFSSDFRSGYLLQYTDAGEQEELVAGQIDAKMTEVNEVPLAVYRDFTPAFEPVLYGIEPGGQPEQLVTTGDPVYFNGGLNDAVGESIETFGVIRTTLDFRGPDTEGFCVFFNATVGSDPFGPPRLMRYCEGPPPFETFTDIILSPGEVIDGYEVGTWGVSPESVDGFNVLVRAVDSNGLNPALIFVGDPPLAADTDSDGVADSADNCTEVANPAQRDTDGDGIGNACDPDLNNDCTVNFQDLSLFKSVFFTSDPDADFDGNGTVNFLDLAVLKQLFFGAPGPSANVCADRQNKSPAGSKSARREIPQVTT